MIGPAMIDTTIHHSTNSYQVMVRTLLANGSA